MTAELTSDKEREWQPSELARLAEVGRFGHERNAAHAVALQQAFDNDPLLTWVYGERSADDQTAFWRLVLDGAIRGTEIHATQTSDAVAVWVPPVGSVPEEPTPDNGENTKADGPTGRDRLAAVLGPRADEIFELFGEIHRVRPETPHWYLQAVGTRPELQGQGWGTRVLAPLLDRCDRLGVPAYLESTNPQNRSFYHRLGFVDIGEITAPGAPALMRMQRPSGN